MSAKIRHAALGAGLAAGAVLSAATVQASSHREAPFITQQPKVDATDFYMFRSYESNRGDFTTLIANYQPLQAPYGGPNYFTLDDEAIYEIHIDNNGDAEEDLTFRFDFETIRNNVELDGVTIPLKQAGGIGPGAGDTANVNVRQTYGVEVVDGDRRSGTLQTVTNAVSGNDTFRKPVDNIGEKTFDNGSGGSHYAKYANNHIYGVDIPGCSKQGKVFVGQREEGFAVNLGEVFDLVNTDPLGNRDAEDNALGDSNVTSLALEVPTDCLTAGSDIIGGWTTASKRQARVLNPAPDANGGGKGPTVEGGAWSQGARLGMPLVNEVAIGVPEKDRFNASEPKDDGQFQEFVTNPTLPRILKKLFNTAVPAQPRNDLAGVFLKGLDGLNRPTDVTASEMLRLNTDIAPKTAGNQNDLGALADDNAGFPNGRRPGDDVVDIALRVTEGALCDTNLAGNCGSDGSDGDPNNGAAFTDGVRKPATEFQSQFPYLNTPSAGSPAN